MQFILFKLKTIRLIYYSKKLYDFDLEILNTSETHNLFNYI